MPTTTTKKVDVFYVSDTTYQKPNPSAPDIGPIDDPNMKAGAKTAVHQRPRQPSRRSPTSTPLTTGRSTRPTSSTLPIDQQLKLEAGIPTTDAVNAFDYYIKNLNHGRPFILAGHSQGSNLLANLLAGYMKKNPKLYQQMVAAYVIGFSITSDYLKQNPQLKFAEGPSDTGVIISYNTEAPVLHGTNPVTMPGGIAINPMTWTRGEQTAPAVLSPGSLALNKEGAALTDSDGNQVRIPHYADAQVSTARGVVICSTEDPYKASGNPAVAAGIYHPFDYPFYYFNLRANAANRVAMYFKNK